MNAPTTFLVFVACHLLVMGIPVVQIGKQNSDAAESTIGPPKKADEAPAGILRLVEALPPDILTVKSGGSTSIVCEFYGFPVGPSDVFWLKNGVPILKMRHLANNKNDPAGTRLSGKNNATLRSPSGFGMVKAKLQFPCLSASDNGLYTCVARSRLGLKASGKTQLVVLDDNKNQQEDQCSNSSAEWSPTVLLSRTILGQTLGTSAVLLCRHSGGDSVSWTTPDEEAVQPTSEKYHVKKNGDLAISNLTFADMGEYTCRVENQAGFDQITTFIYPILSDDED